MSIGYCESGSRNARTTQWLRLVSSKEILWLGSLQKPRLSFDFLFVFYDFFFDFWFFTSWAHLPYLRLIFEAHLGFLQPIGRADSKSPEYHTLTFTVTALTLFTVRS